MIKNENTPKQDNSNKYELSTENPWVPSPPNK